jgi:hypothetical protein
VLFTGEMVFPWMFDDFACLQPYKQAANLIAAKQDWPKLYRPEVLQANTVSWGGGGGMGPLGGGGQGSEEWGRERGVRGVASDTDRGGRWVTRVLAHFRFCSCRGLLDNRGWGEAQMGCQKTEGVPAAQRCCQSPVACLFVIRQQLVMWRRQGASFVQQASSSCVLLGARLARLTQAVYAVDIRHIRHTLVVQFMVVYRPHGGQHGMAACSYGVLVTALAIWYLTVSWCAPH